jgi:hypothetical protein
MRADRNWLPLPYQTLNPEQTIAVLMTPFSFETCDWFVGCRLYFDLQSTFIRYFTLIVLLLCCSDHWIFRVTIDTYKHVWILLKGDDLWKISSPLERKRTVYV